MKFSSSLLEKTREFDKIASIYSVCNNSKIYHVCMYLHF